VIDYGNSSGANQDFRDARASKVAYPVEESSTCGAKCARFGSGKFHCVCERVGKVAATFLKFSESDSGELDVQAIFLCGSK